MQQFASDRSAQQQRTNSQSPSQKQSSMLENRTGKSAFQKRNGSIPTGSQLQSTIGAGHTRNSNNASQTQKASTSNLVGTQPT